VRILFTSIAAWLLVGHAHAQFAPQVGFAGCTAIFKDSGIIVAWADTCSITRGWQNIQDTSLGFASAGTQTEAIAKADGQTCSLGDKGYAIYYFSNPICDKPGADFVIFENGFRNANNDSLAFLELATVSISTNGIDFIVFPATSTTSTQLQLGSFSALTNASHINNLAGKYLSEYGTPFDLSELVATPLIDLQNIRFIKVTDVCGSINNTEGTFDQNQNIINDPFPTPFNSSGFDLDALGIIHQKHASDIADLVTAENFFVYPNPSAGIVFVESPTSDLQIYNAIGMRILVSITTLNSAKYSADLSAYPAGCYYIKAGTTYKRIVIN
jgi:hypothetical protein